MSFMPFKDTVFSKIRGLEWVKPSKIRGLEWVKPSKIRGLE